MRTANLIAADEFCGYHRLEQTFIAELEDAGLVSVTIIDQRSYIANDQLPQLEKMIRMHQDLDINVPGIASITHLLERVESMQQELLAMRNLLQIYAIDKV